MITVNFYRRTPLQVNFRIDTPVNVTGGGGGGVTDHGQLTGLGDDDHPQYFNQSRGDARYSFLGHTHTPSQVGLGNVDNTSDANKPISNDTQSALNGKENSITGGTTSQYFRGDKTFQTLDKAAVGLSNVDNTSDANKPVSNATQTALNGKENTIATGTTAQYFRGDKTFQTLDKAVVGLSNVDNTSDANKPVSTATQTALNGKENSITAGTTSQYFRGDKSFQTLDKVAVGLGNVDNTSDANKPISNATQSALNDKQNTLSLTTTGSSGPATLVGGTLNIPQYSGGGGGGSLPTVTTLTSTSNTLTISGIFQIVRADTTSNNITATLPTAVGNTGYMFWIKRVSGGSNIVTVDTVSSQTIDGASTAVLTVQYEAVGFYSNGSNWEII